MPKAFITGLGGTRLTPAERAFIAAHDPLGFILFARNVSEPEPLRLLTAELRDAVGRADAPVLVDQEGGRVARLGPPCWRASPPAALFGRLARIDGDAAIRAVYLDARLIGTELRAAGITVDGAPVLDVPIPGADPVIGDRAFDDDPGRVAALGAAFCDGLAAAGIVPVLKHIPGHGRARVDSHRALPRVGADRATLHAHDFAPFKAVAGRAGPEPWAMTAHVVYAALDADRPATLSPVVIGEAVRATIGFAGVLISDDLSMGALSGPVGTRAAAALDAGCDLVLHCNGNLAEMGEVAAACPAVAGETAARLSRSIGAVGTPSSFDAAAAGAELERLLAPVLQGAR